MRWNLGLIPLLLALVGGCSPCSDYCEEQCACDGDEADGCVEACLDTLDVYSPDVRGDECTDRLEELQETCR